MKSNRYGLIDFLRGLNLISMIIYHACWDLQFMFGVNVPGYTGRFGLIWQKSICITFILISGFCINFSKNKKKKILRGVLISVCGAVITYVTVVFMPDSPIYFGILTFMGFAMILFALLSDSLSKANPYIGAIVCFILFIVFYDVIYGSIGFLGLFHFDLPRSLYANMVTAFLGFPSSSFCSSDYFSVLPWIFLYGCGFYFGIIFNRTGLTKILCKPKDSVFNWIGKNTLIIYMLHQPIIYGVLSLIYK
ncbi:MAG: heparan-alpha-glucosaminide N-acetyltransferase [Lachnospiraceae bacterium]|nr:heparan-alpha-glucosaminide N-acetyltransferase [Lachnospiraceae bacterium]